MASQTNSVASYNTTEPDTILGTAINIRYMQYMGVDTRGALGAEANPPRLLEFAGSTLYS